MKKLYAGYALIISLSAFMNSRSGAATPGENNLRNNAPAKSLSTLSFGQDVIIKPETEQQHDVKIATAFNGWIYAAFTMQSGSDTSGYTIMKSVNHGQTWDTVTRLIDTALVYYSSDLIICGRDIDTLHLYFSTAAYDRNSGEHFFLLNKYDGNSDSLIRNVVMENEGTDSIYDVALANDFLHPSSSSTGTFPYSVEAMYSKAGTPLDSIIAFQFLNAALGQGDRKVVDTTSADFGKIALSYGYSPFGHPNGRYFLAYEEHITGSLEGHIKLTGNDGDITDVFTVPLNLDDLDASWTNHSSNPSISVQNSGNDNDSAGLSAVVVWESNINGTGNADAVGAYIFEIVGNSWYPFALDNSVSTNTRQPDVSYDQGADRFIATYWDETNNSLLYKSQGFNFPSPASWTLLAGQYNDQVGTLVNPRPQIIIDPLFGTADFAWIESRNNYPLALFDAENYITAVSENQPARLVLNQNFPNPANASTIIGFELPSSQEVSLEIFDLVGNTIATLRNNVMAAGYHECKMDVRSLPPGYYMYTLKAESVQFSKKLLVVH